MRRNRFGLALLLLGILMLLTRTSSGNLLIELIWLTGFAFLAAFVWRALAGRAPWGVRLGAHALLALLATSTLNRLAGAAFLGFMALGFWLVYRQSPGGRRGTGWALIPAGVLSSLALVAGVDSLFPRWDGGSLFLLGMTATFTAIYLLPRERGGGRWALWPALAWAGITLLANDPGGGLGRLLPPLALIGIGVAVLGWARGRQKR